MKYIFVRYSIDNPSFWIDYPEGKKRGSEQQAEAVFHIYPCSDNASEKEILEVIFSGLDEVLGDDDYPYLELDLPNEQTEQEAVARVRRRGLEVASGNPDKQFWWVSTENIFSPMFIADQFEKVRGDAYEVIKEAAEELGYRNCA